MSAQRLDETVDRLSARQLLERLSQIYRWLLVADADSRVVWMSEGLSGLFGIDDIGIGTDVRTFLAKLPRAEQVFSIRDELRHRHVCRASLDLRTRDGRIIPTDLSVLKLEATEGGGATLLVAIARPQDEARRSPDPSWQLIDRAPLALIAIDADGFIVHANPAAVELTGHGGEELVGQPVALLLGDGPGELERLSELFGARSRRECHVSLRCADGALHPMAVAAKVSGEGSDRLVMLSLRDVGEQARVEAELRHANEDLEHCVNSLAHDLRSPLVALLGFSRLLRQEYEPLLDPTGRHFLDRIEQAGRTMETLVHDLLELSRIGQAGERLAMVDPRGVLAQLKAELKPRLDASGTELVLQDPPPALVYCDRTRLYQLFSNLIGNAIDHMGQPESPRIEVSVRDEPEGHHIVVRDNGRGIPPEQAARVFDAFQSFSRADGHRGTGMGLAIVKKIAEKRGGRVWVDTAPGEGCAFHVLLPSA